MKLYHHFFFIYINSEYFTNIEKSSSRVLNIPINCDKLHQLQTGSWIFLKFSTERDFPHEHIGLNISL